MDLSVSEVVGAVVHGLGRLDASTAMVDASAAFACQAPASWWMRVVLEAADLTGRRVPQVIDVALRRSGLPPERLVVELPARSAAAGRGSFEVPRAIASLGVHLAVDRLLPAPAMDRLLGGLPIGSVRVDGALALGDGHDRRVLAAHLLRAHELGLALLADNVTSGDLALLLAVAACPLGRGPWWAGAQPIDALVRSWETGDVV